MKDKMLKEPTFEEFMKNQAEGRDMFDNFGSVENEQDEQEQEFQRITEEQENDNLYKRELLARLFGGTLTSRQYSVLFGQVDANEDQDEALKNAMEYKAQRRSKTDIKVHEECLESYRRQKVIKGEWAEHDS